jgi:hypothetical protein
MSNWGQFCGWQGRIRCPLRGSGAATPIAVRRSGLPIPVIPGFAYFALRYPHQGAISRNTAPISAWMTMSALPSMSVGSRLTMASAAPFDFATIGSAAAG